VPNPFPLALLASIVATGSVTSNNVRAFLEEPRFAVMATINALETPQLTVMCFALSAEEDNVVVLNATRGLLKERSLRRDPRMSLCIEDGLRYVALQGRAELVDDLNVQEREVNEVIAPRHIGRRLGSQHWQVIKDYGRLGIRMHVERVHTRGV
jgi:PPOX class probable F420-dependent enzyme